jgi:sn-glycerol 3-phosphate transport system permease protein
MTETTHIPIAKRRLKWGRVLDHTILILGSLFMLVPLLMLLQTTTTTDLETIKNGPEFVIGTQIDDNFREAMFTASGFSGENTGLRMLVNSLILGIGFALGKIIIGMMAAYALVYFRLRFATFAFWLIFTTLLLPLEVRILPSYEIAQKLGLLNTYTGLILPLIASATATFFFRQFFRSIPEEMVEAARIDGAGFWLIFFRIILPVSIPILVVSIIWQFTQIWNDFLFGVVYSAGGDQPITVALNNLVNTSTGIKEYNVDMAAAIIAALPTLFVYVVAGKYFVRGLTAGAVKG